MLSLCATDWLLCPRDKLETSNNQDRQSVELHTADRETTKPRQVNNFDTLIIPHQGNSANYIQSHIHNVTECIVCVQGHDPAFSFLSSFLFFDWVGILWPQLSKVLKLVRWACSVLVPGEIKRSRGGRWNWTFKLAQKRS